jgi:adenosylcobinamide kinase/adenosylcobinamide-phosphate guanylyltransferase
LSAEITLVLGGARSGKSELAEQLAGELGSAVAYLATGAAPGGDPDWAERVARHRARRPSAWITVEVGPGGDLTGALRAASQPVLVDSLGTWVAGLPEFGQEGDRSGLCHALAERRSSGRSTVVVSEEVGLGVHPATEVGRRFRDALGELNRRVADLADTVQLVVAGRVLVLGRAR